jgi:hypothetical protein
MNQIMFVKKKKAAAVGGASYIDEGFFELSGTGDGPYTATVSSGGDYTFILISYEDPTDPVNPNNATITVDGNAATIVKTGSEGLADSIIAAISGSFSSVTLSVTFDGTPQNGARATILSVSGIDSITPTSSDVTSFGGGTTAALTSLTSPGDGGITIVCGTTRNNRDVTFSNATEVREEYSGFDHLVAVALGDLAGDVQADLSSGDFGQITGVTLT